MRPVNVSSLTNPRDVDQAPAPAHSSRRQQNNRPSTKMTGRAPSLLSINGLNQFHSVIFTFPNDYLVEFLLPPTTTTPTLEAGTLGAGFLVFIVSALHALLNDGPNNGKILIEEKPQLGRYHRQPI